MPETWKFLGEGTHSRVYVNLDKTKVLKTQKDSSAIDK